MDIGLFAVSVSADYLPLSQSQLQRVYQRCGFVGLKPCSFLPNLPGCLKSFAPPPYFEVGKPGATTRGKKRDADSITKTEPRLRSPAAEDPTVKEEAAYEPARDFLNNLLSALVDHLNIEAKYVTFAVHYGLLWSIEMTRLLLY